MERKVVFPAPFGPRIPQKASCGTASPLLSGLPPVFSETIRRQKSFAALVLQRQIATASLPFGFVLEIIVTLFPSDFQKYMDLLKWRIDPLR